MSRYYDTLNLADSLRINNTTVIDSSRNLTNIASISASGGISVTGYNTISSYAGSFSFITGSLTGNVTGNVTGNASTTTKWATARTITLSGDLTGSVSIDGSANVTLSAQVTNNSHDHDHIQGSSYSSDDLNTVASRANAGELHYDAFSSTAPNKPPTSDNANGVITIGQHTGNYTAQLAFSSNGRMYHRDNPTTYGSWQTVFSDAYHPNADKWTTARTLALTGDVTGSVSWDGSANASITATVANDSHTHDTTYLRKDGTNQVADANQFLRVGRSVSSGYCEMRLDNDVDDHIIMGSIGSTYSDSSWAGSSYLYSNRNLRIKSGTSLEFYAGGMTNTSRIARVESTGIDLLLGNYKVNGTTVIDSSSNLTNIGNINAGAITNDNTGAVRILHPDGASYSSNGATGAIKIRLPVAWTNTMMRMSVKVYEYTTGESFEVNVGGYNHTGSNGLWYNTFAQVISDPDTNRNFTVRYGHDGTRACIWIGETNSSWSYPKVSVVDFQAGHSYSNEATWASGWAITIESSLGTIQHTHTNNEVGIDGYEKRIGGTTVIDASRNLTNIGTISASGSISVTGYNSVNAHSGSFTYITGALTGNVVGNVTGNASTATKWATARTLSLTGDVTGSVSWDGSANASITTTVANNSHTHTVDNISGLVEGTSFSGEYASLFHIGGNRIFSDASMRFRGSDSRLTVDGIVNTSTYQVNGTTVIDSGRNITVGAITASGKLYFNKDGQTNYHSVIDIDHVENNLWSFVFQSSTVGNDNESGFWVGNNGYPDMRIRRDNGTVRALISSWETSYVSNNFNVAGGDLQVGGNTVIDSTRNATVNKVTATASGMSEFSTDLSSNDDWLNSPISIRERNMAGSAASADMYAPNLNFHWSGKASNSLWMNSAGHLVYGGYGDTGIPAANGVIAAGAIRTNTLTDLADTSTFLELEGDSLGMRLQTVNGFFRFGARNSTWCHMETDRSGFYFYKKINVVGTTNSTTGYQLNGTTVIDSSRNLTNIGNVTGGDGNFNHIGVRNTSGASGDGISLYNGATGGQPTYGIMFAGTSTYGGHGGVTGDWATYLTMSNNTDRGWIFKRGTTNVASIDGGGNATFTGSVSSSNAVTATGNITSNNGWVKSGGGGFYVSGNQIVNSSRDLLNIGNITCSGTNNTLGDINIQENVSAQGYTFMRFKAYSTGNTLGSIYRAYGSMVYSTSSDYRLKENVVDLTGASVKIMSLPVRRFNFIEHPDRTVDGFLAHEVAEVVPEAVIGEKDAVDSKGKPVHQSIDQSKLVPLLTAGLQEALAEIENLKARLSALEN